MIYIDWKETEKKEREKKRIEIKQEGENWFEKFEGTFIKWSNKNNNNNPLITQSSIHNLTPPIVYVREVNT